MKLLRATSVLVLSALALTACDDGDDPTDVVTTADLAGSWTATQFEYSDDTGDAPGLGIDAIDLGGSVILNVQSSGAFTGTINIPQLTPGELPIGGTIAVIDQENLSIDFNATTESYGLFGDFDASFTLVGDVLTFVNDDTSFDFPDAIEPTPRGAVAATLTASFQRN